MSGTYEPLTIMSGTPCDLYPLAKGVLGYAIEARGKVYIPAIVAVKEGSGAVGTFLNSLSARCVIPNVTSARLRGMLERRGFKETQEVDEILGEPCDVWVQL